MSLKDFTPGLRTVEFDDAVNPQRGADDMRRFFTNLDLIKASDASGQRVVLELSSGYPEHRDAKHPLLMLIHAGWVDDVPFVDQQEGAVGNCINCMDTGYTGTQCKRCARDMIGGRIPNYEIRSFYTWSRTYPADEQDRCRVLFWHPHVLMRYLKPAYESGTFPRQYKVWLTTNMVAQAFPDYTLQRHDHVGVIRQFMIDRLAPVHFLDSDVIGYSFHHKFMSELFLGNFHNLDGNFANVLQQMIADIPSLRGGDYKPRSLGDRKSLCARVFPGQEERSYLRVRHNYVVDPDSFILHSTDA